jgi:dCTP deaminase
MPRAEDTNLGGLLSDLEILELLVAEGTSGIFVSPLVNPAVQLGPSSLDVHLGAELSAISAEDSTHLDLTNKAALSKELQRHSHIRRIGPDEHFVLHPSEFALGSTLEFFRLPNNIAGRLEGRSSFGRVGLQVHATAGFVDPGFVGTLTFELINSGTLPLKIAPGLRLGQICFFRMSRAAEFGYMDKSFSKYGRALGIRTSRIYDDPK